MSIEKATSRIGPNLMKLRQIANSIMYEGYLLYPYRTSALKNQYRWTFGVVFPRAYIAAENNTDHWFTQTQCLIQVDGAIRLSATSRFLQDKNGEYLEREVEVSSADLHANSSSLQIERDIEGLHLKLELQIEVLSEALSLYKLSFRMANITPLSSEDVNRESALRHSLLGAHSIFQLERGSFISMTHYADNLHEYIEQCRNEAVWPVLAGDRSASNILLSSPIILEDFPRTAAQSPGDLFDGTEIDELLSLSILTLAEDEKNELRKADHRAQELLERVESLGQEDFMKMHGLMIRQTPDIKIGDALILRPKRRADAFDMLLDGRRARVLDIEEDREGVQYVTVSIDDDPGFDLGQEGKPGHRFFFAMNEVEKI